MFECIILQGVIFLKISLSYIIIWASWRHIDELNIDKAYTILGVKLRIWIFANTWQEGGGGWTLDTQMDRQSN